MSHEVIDVFAPPRRFFGRAARLYERKLISSSKWKRG